VRFTRKRFGRYEVIDFLAVLFGYAISGERTLEEFYQPTGCATSYQRTDETAWGASVKRL
jgi:hypothetical protein